MTPGTSASWEQAVAPQTLGQFLGTCQESYAWGCFPEQALEGGSL